MATATVCIENHCDKSNLAAVYDGYAKSFLNGPLYANIYHNDMFKLLWCKATTVIAQRKED